MSILWPTAADRRRRIVAAARLLESDKAGERDAALFAILRLLPEGVSLAELIEQALTPQTRRAPEPVPARPRWDMRSDPLRPWQEKARVVAAHRETLNERELAFVLDMTGRRDAPTPRQRNWLEALFTRVEMRRAA